MTLAAMCREHRRALLGGAELLEGRFPLLFKYIDARSTLSVQVHPDEEACLRLGGGARPKTEAWYIVNCEPGSVLYVGLKKGVDRPSFARAIEEGTVESLLHRVEVKPGDFVFLPSGAIHAIGSGILLAEVQQSSNTTYRVFDWNRVGLDGKPRQLHVSEALDSIAFGTHGVPDAVPPASGRSGVACDYFVMESILLSDGQSAQLGGDGLLVLMGLDGDGEVNVRADSSVTSISRGTTCLVPAETAGRVELESTGQITVLATRIPA